MVRDLIPEFRKGKIITGDALERLRIDATQQQGGRGLYVDGTGAYGRPMHRRERGVWFKPATDVPAYGVMYVTNNDTTQGELVLTTKKPDGIALGEIIVVNGPEDVDSGVYGKCFMFGDVSRQALVNSSETVANGDVLGPKSSQWDLYKDFPGLIAFSAKDDDDLAWCRLQQDPTICFEMKVDMPTSGSVAAGQSGVAYRLKPDGSIDTGTEFTVYDERGVYRLRANGKYSGDHDRGSQGVAGWHYAKDRIRILSATPNALMIMGTINEEDTPSGITKAEGSFDVDNVYVMQPSGSIITDTDPASDTFGITNRKFDGDDGTEVIAVWDEKDLDWKAIDVICPT